MRRMNYDRFAKPVNFGEFDHVNSRFVLENEIENGLYLVTIEEHNDVDVYKYTGLITIDGTSNETYSSNKYLSLNYNNGILVFNENSEILEDSTYIVKFYKLD